MCCVLIKCTLFDWLILNFEKLRALMPLCIISYKLQNCKSYLIPHITTFVAWKQSYSHFSEQLDFFKLEKSMKFVLLRFYLLYFVSMVFLHLLYIPALDFFPWGYLNFPTV